MLDWIALCLPPTAVLTGLPPKSVLAFELVEGRGSLVGAVSNVSSSTGAPADADVPTQQCVYPHSADRTRTAELAAAEAGHVEAVFISGTFLLLAPSYATELIELRFESGCRVEVVLRRLAAARSPNARDRFPRLIEVRPQPRVGLALVLALPPWPVDGAVVAVDCRVGTECIFAVQLPRLADRDGILRAVGFQPEDDIDIFPRDVPGALERGFTVSLAHGDMLTLLPRLDVPPVTQSILRILADASRWQQEAFVPGDFSNSGWIVAHATDYTGPPEFRHHFVSERGHLLRQDLAELLGVQWNHLVLRPAVPNVSDHMHLGTVSRGVLAAICTTDGTHYRAPRHPICFLDARPILLSFSCCWAPQSELNPGPLIQRFAPRCPAGHKLVAARANGKTWDMLHVAHVDDGEIIELRFEPALATNHPNLGLAAADDDYLNRWPDGDVTPASKPADRDPSGGRCSGTPPLAYSAESRTQRSCALVLGVLRRTACTFSDVVDMWGTLPLQDAPRRSKVRLTSVLRWSVWAWTCALCSAGLTLVSGLALLLTLCFARGGLGVLLVVLCIGVGPCAVAAPTLPSSTLPLTANSASATPWDCAPELGLSICAGSAAAGSRRPIPTPCRVLSSLQVVHAGATRQDGDANSTLRDAFCGGPAPLPQPHLGSTDGLLRPIRYGLRDVSLHQPLEMRTTSLAPSWIKRCLMARLSSVSLPGTCISCSARTSAASHSRSACEASHRSCALNLLPL